MPDELTELLDTAIYKEISAQALYIASQKKTPDQGARALMKELAQEELGHSQRLKSLKERGWRERDWQQEKVHDLKISEYLTGPDTLKEADLQDVLVFAMKREQQSIEFYSKMMGVIRDEAAKRLCENLAHDELRHKHRLELLYDDLYYKED